MSRYNLTEFIVISLLIHLGCLALLRMEFASSAAASAGEKVEIKIVEKQIADVRLPAGPSKSPKIKQPRPPVLPADKGEMIPQEDTAGGPEPVPIEDYADELKSKVDPIWYAKIKPILSSIPYPIQTNVLIFPDKYGNVISMKVIKSSGRRDVDQTALDTFRTVRQIPVPPMILIQKGIIWEFTVGS